MGYTETQNRYTNGITFLDQSGKTLHYQQPAFNTDSFQFPSPILIGKAHVNKFEKLVREPYDFTKHNNLSLEDMQRMLQAVVYPGSVPKEARFNINDTCHNIHPKPPLPNMMPKFFTIPMSNSFSTEQAARFLNISGYLIRLDGLMDS
jgi:hypothetical protein